MESSWGGLPHLTRGDVSHPRACQTGLAVSVQRALVGQVAWKVKGECAHVLPALGNSKGTQQFSSMLRGGRMSPGPSVLGAGPASGVC